MKWIEKKIYFYYNKNEKGVCCVNETKARCKNCCQYIEARVEVHECYWAAYDDRTVLIQSTHFFHWKYVPITFRFLMKHFSLSNCCYDNWKSVLFPISMTTIVRETNYFITIMQLINPNYPWKNSQTDVYSKNCGKCVPSTLLLSAQTLILTMGSKCCKNVKMSFLDFYYHSSYTLMDLICLTNLIFLKFPWWSIWTFCARDLLTGTILVVWFKHY